jgi:hypothetical protein
MRNIRFVEVPLLRVYLSTQERTTPQDGAGTETKRRRIAMNLEIRRQGIEVNDEVYTHIERRLLFALDKFSPHVQRVAVYLEI